MRSLLVGLMVFGFACSEESGGNEGDGNIILPQPMPMPMDGTQPGTMPGMQPPANTTPPMTNPGDTGMPMMMMAPDDMMMMPAGDMMMMDMGTAGMPSTDPPAMAEPLAFTATDFTDGSMIPARFRCDAPSPALSWSGGPAETMSYAVVVTDLGLDLLHWVLYDIPAATTSIAEGVPEGAAPATPAGAKQAPIDALVASTAGTGAERFVGPCAPFGTSSYEFKLYALGEAALSGAGAAGPDVKTALEAAALESTTLTITSMP